MRLAYSRRSLRHLQGIYDYIAVDNAAAAARVVVRIRAAADRLRMLPLSGRPARGGVRILSVAGLPYIVIYRVLENEVRILTVFHTSRNRSFR
jgi:plasmid stabilization system protein ParE